MANNFKTDDSFLRKLVVGAAGTNATIKRLKELGFDPIELERGSTGFKIWKKIKIKRVRVPDVLCLKTGLRFESRGKTKLEISMSHSLNDPKRSWDAGMRDDDMVSIVAFAQDDENPTNISQASPIHFVSVKDMRETFSKEQVSITTPKGFEEGSEIRVIWTSAIVNQESQIVDINADKISMIPNKRDGLSWALARIGNFDVSNLITSTDNDLRKWISYIIGYGKNNFAEVYIEKICKSDPEVYFAASVLWQILTSWINGLKEY